MHDIPMSEVTPEFARCWQAAGMHIEDAADGQLNAWLRAHLNPPFLEHLSFRLGNQLFFLRVEDEEDQIEGPGSLQGLLSVADGCKGHAVFPPFRAVLKSRSYAAMANFWIGVIPPSAMLGRS